MRRILLDPPRMVLEELGGPVTVGRPASSVAPAAPPDRRVLDGVAQASERRRYLFHPKRGWFRRLERGVAHALADAAYPRIPGLARVYDRQLRLSLTLSEAEIPLAGLGAGFDDLRILLITDVHAGPLVSPNALHETFRRLMELEPDLVLLGGDLITSRVRDFTRARDAFGGLCAPLGVFAVFGNHEYYSEDPERLREDVEAAGIRVLDNAWIALERGDSRLALAGVDDALIGRPDLERALDGAPRPVILLSHNPDLLFDAARRQVSLMLSGHTHAGQMRVPGLPVLVRQSRFRLDEGRYRWRTTELLVSRGLGVSGLPWRVACPPEAVLIRLRRSRA